MRSKGFFMQFTPLHRLLGRPPGPLTDEMIDEAIAEGLVEADDLDWKDALPPAKGITSTDFPKDVAAMANSGGGIIVYGVTEDQKRANGRRPVEALTEAYSRTLHSAAVTAISPPVFGLAIVELGEDDRRVVAVAVPDSPDGPHLIYRNEYFGAPRRNDADTVWMKERQVEAAYRARFDERRHSYEALDRMFQELSIVSESDSRAWFIAVGRPRGANAPIRRWPRVEAQTLFREAAEHALGYVRRQNTSRPFEIVSLLNPAVGLRRWVVRTHRSENRREATASIHFDGSASVASAIGGHHNGTDAYFEAWEYQADLVSASIADFMGLVRAVGLELGSVDYEVRIGIVRSGPEQMRMYSSDRYGFVDPGYATSMSTYIPVEATIDTSADDSSFLHQVRDIIRDCLNQGGVEALRGVEPCICDLCSQ